MARVNPLQQKKIPHGKSRFTHGKSNFTVFKGVHLSGLVCLFSLAILQFAEEFLVSAVVNVQYDIDRKSL